MSLIRSGFLSHIVKQNKPLHDRIIINSLQGNLNLKANLADLFKDFENNLIHFDSLVREIYSLIAQYDFVHIKKTLTSVHSSDLTYLDKLVILFWKQPNPKNYQNLKVLVNYIYDDQLARNELIKRISKLTENDYYKIMNETDPSPLDGLYSHENLEAVIGYLWLLSDKFDNSSNFWQLIDNGLGYCFHFLRHIEKQIQCYDILVQKSPGTEIWLEKLNHYRDCVNKLAKKFPNWLICLKMKPNDPDEYRIYYLVNSLVKDTRLGEIYQLDLVPIEKCKFYDVAIHTLAELPKTIVNHEMILYFIRMSYSMINQEERSPYGIGNSLNDINVFLDKNHEIFQSFLNLEKVKRTDIDQIHNWLHSYFSMIIASFDLYEECKTIMKKGLSYYSYAVVTIKDLVKVILKSLQIISQFNYFSNHLTGDLKYQLKELMTVVIRHLNDQDILKTIHMYSEITALGFLTQNWLESLNDFELKDIKNELVVLGGQIPKIALNPDIVNRFNNLVSYDLPDEFMDPITVQEIHEPRKLPQTGQIMEKDVIHRILRQNPVNPFSCSPLNIEELEQFNENANIKDEMIKFKERKLKFLSSQK